jgi:ParB-like chromosome segregation protein Spo0J
MFVTIETWWLQVPDSEVAVHDLANLFTPMPENEFEQFKESMRHQGLLEPIIIYQNKILDGVHRCRAC